VPGKENSARIYLFEGTDDGLKERAIEELAEELIDPASRDFDFEVIDGSSATAQRVISAAGITPFSSRARVVLVRRANQMPESEQKSLALMLPGVPQSACLILMVPAAESSDGKQKKGSSLVPELAEAARKCGSVRRFDRGKKEDVTRLASELLAREGKRARGDVLTLLAERSGGDSNILASEIRKLADYVGERLEITAQDVRVVTAETLEERIFALVDAIGQRNEARAVALTREYMDSAARSDAAALRLLTMIARQLRFLWQASILQQAGVRLGAPLGDLPENLRDSLPRDGNIVQLIRRHAWQARKLDAQARNFNRTAIARALELVAEADLTLKGIDDRSGDPRTVAELLVLRLCRI